MSVTRATSQFCVDATSAAKALQSSKTNLKSFDGSATSAAKVAPRRSPFFKAFDGSATSAAKVVPRRSPFSSTATLHQRRISVCFHFFTNARKPKSSLRVNG